MAAGIDRSKTDNNQTKIVEALRLAGCFVQSLAGVGKGCADILVGNDGRWCVMRIYDPEDSEYNENISKNRRKPK